MSAVMTNDQNANGVVHYSKKKMLRKTMKINSPNIPLTNREGFRPRRRLYHEMPQLRIELLCKFRCRYFLVIGHDRIEYPNKPSDEGRAASGFATAFDSFVQLFK